MRERERENFTLPTFSNSHRINHFESNDLHERFDDDFLYITLVEIVFISQIFYHRFTSIYK